MGNKRILAGMAAVALCCALVPFARDWFDPIDSLWNPTKDCFPLDEQFDRGMMFLKRQHFAERNHRKAEEWLLASASQGYSDAQLQLDILRRETVLAKGGGKRAGERKVVQIGSQNVAFRWCPATTSGEWKSISGGKGFFKMGSDSGEEGRYDDESPVSVELSHGFWMAETEVTQGLWKDVMDGETILSLVRKGLEDDAEYNINGKKQTFRDSFGKNRDADPEELCADMDDHVPVYFVNWFEANLFCKKLNEWLQKEGTLPEGYEIRLPTEAEWEYACRAGTKTALPNGRDIAALGELNAPNLNDIAWYGGNSSVGFSGRGWETENWQEKQFPGGLAGPRRVGTKLGNRWGLCDMLGNVREWCYDWKGEYPDGTVSNPFGAVSGSSRIVRGGAWNYYVRCCRSAYREGSDPRYRAYDMGFRFVLAPIPEIHELDHFSFEEFEPIHGEGSRAGIRRVVRVGSKNLPLRWCPATTSDEWKRISDGKDYFVMGRDIFSDESDVDKTDGEIITNGFWIGETEVTQGLFSEVLGETVADIVKRNLNDDTKYHFDEKLQTWRDSLGLAKDTDPFSLCGDIDDEMPVYHVRYGDARRFCEKLTERLRSTDSIPDGYEFRLPDEREWEYACRAGTANELPNGEKLVILGENNAPALDGIAWYGGNSSVGFAGRGWNTETWEGKQYPGGVAGPRRVGTKAANNWGIRDMIGNVCEWCSGELTFTPPEDWEDTWGTGTRTFYISRGGSWASSSEDCKWWLMSFSELGRGSEQGFRVVLAPVQ